MSFKKKVQGTAEWDSDSFKISGVLKHGQYTGTEAEALTPENGDVIYITTTSTVFTSVGFWGYENGAWGKIIIPELWKLLKGNPYNLKVPTETELNTERLSWSTQDSVGAFGSPLKLTVGGLRDTNGMLGFVNSLGAYFSVTVSNSNIRFLSFEDFNASIGNQSRAFGCSLRIIVDGTFTQTEFDNNYLNETVTINGLNYGFVYNPTTSKIWLDRNLGATQVATSSTDSNAYGDLFQWGRDADGHEKRTSTTTTVQATTPQPDHGDFIISFNDWLTPQNDNLWQGVDGINNPIVSEKLIGSNGKKASYNDLLDLPTPLEIEQTRSQSTTAVPSSKLLDDELNLKLDTADFRDKFFVVPATTTWTVTPNTADHINVTVPHTNQTVLFDFLNSVNEFDPFYFYVPKSVTGTQVNSTNYTGTFSVNSLTGTLTTNASGNFDIPENTFWKIIYRLSGEIVMMQISNVDNTRIEQATITNITFAKQQTYGTPTTPLTGAFTVDNFEAKPYMIQKIYHNAASEPTILSGSTFFKAGTGEYVPSVLNVIFIEWITTTRYEYWIVQFS